MLLLVAEPDANDGSVRRTDGVGSCLRKHRWRVLLIVRVVQRRRRTTVSYGNVPQRYPDAQYLRLLRRDTVSPADSAAELDTDRFTDRGADRAAKHGADRGPDWFAFSTADLGTKYIADARPNRHADVATDASSDPRTDAVPINSSMHHCVQLAGGNVRRRSRRQLLRKSSRVRGG